MHSILDHNIRTHRMTKFDLILMSNLVLSRCYSKGLALATKVATYNQDTLMKLFTCYLLAKQGANFRKYACSL